MRSGVATAGLRHGSCASPSLMVVVYAGVILFGLNEFRKAPVGFIPQVDQGYLIIVTQLPGGASLARTDEVNRRVAEIALQVPGLPMRSRLLRLDPKDVSRSGFAIRAGTRCRSAHLPPSAT